MQTDIAAHDTDQQQGRAINSTLNHGSSRTEKQMNAGTKTTLLAGSLRRHIQPGQGGVKGKTK